MKNNDNSISISPLQGGLLPEDASTLRPRQRVQQQPFNTNDKTTSFGFNTIFDKRNNIINIDNRLVNCFGSALFDLIFNMQHEILANIWLRQHNLTFSNSNIVFVTSQRYSTFTNFFCDLNFLQVSIFHFRSGQRIPLLIECFSDSDWAGDVNTRQSTFRFAGDHLEEQHAQQ